MAFPLLFLGAGLVLVQPCAGAPVVFSNTGSLGAARYDHTATLLPSGKVLVAGGVGSSGNELASAELYDPASGTWTATGSLGGARFYHTATLLPNGKVLVAGGRGTSASAELYDPASGTWTGTGSLTTARELHTATLLPNGKVLVAGGNDNNGVPLASAELYDPANRTWKATGSLATARNGHAATLLPNGKVLVAGGFNGGTLTSAELYDPASGINGSWTATGSLGHARANHTATLLPNGKVLVAGGADNSFNALASAELFDPASGTNGTWTTTGSLGAARIQHTATLLPNGTVLVTGGYNSSAALASAELYDQTNQTWTATGSLGQARDNHTATLLPNGKVLVAGGINGPSLASAELYDPASGSWTGTGSLATARQVHTATLLPNGKVLVAGGAGSSTGSPLASAELYDPASGTWTATGSLGGARFYHTATLLPNGKVLVAGGNNNTNALASAELYDPASGTWTATGPLATSRFEHTATLLPNGKVLVAGGFNSSGSSLASAELYDPASGSWTATGSLGAARRNHTATLLPNGKVLAAGGLSGGSPLASAELYDPASGTWTATGSLGAARYLHTATLLPNGNVLVAGGFGNSALPSAELYDPASGTWTATGNLASARYDHTAALLPSGKVLVAGGQGSSSLLVSVELYDPASGSWTATGSLATARQIHTATLLPNGKVLVAGGLNTTSSTLASAELYDVGLGFSGAWQPQIATAPSTLQSGTRLILTGSLFKGISQASGGNFQDSSSNYPIVQLRSLESSQVVFLLVDPTVGWSNTAFTSLPVSGFPFGPSLVTVFTNGIPSAAKYLVFGQPKISVEQPIDTPLVNNTSTVDFGNVMIGSSLTLGFAIRNNGSVDLTGIAITVGGTNSSDFPLDTFRTSSTLAPGANTTFNIAFQPKAPPGSRSAALHITSNDATNSPFNIALTGASVKANPTINTTASPATTAGGTISDSATLSNGNNPTGTITFTVYGPDNASCVGTAAFTSITPVSDNGPYSSDSFIPTSLGTYRFVASYSGDANNNAVAGACGDPGESVVVNPTPTPTPTPTATPTPTPTPTATPTPTPSTLLNISTRMRVLTGDQVLIGGFIITGTDPKTVIIRGIGPSLSGVGVALSDPTLELHQGSTVTTNDNWKINDQTGQSQEAAIRATTIPPPNDLESAVIATLAPGNYTAILAGKNGGTGVGLVEVYDLAQAANSKLANISTRGFVDTGNNVMIGGLIVGGGSGGGAAKVIVRALGPSLSGAGVAGVLADPTLELHDGSGTTLATNDNWKINDQTGQSQEADIRATTIPPSNDLESAIVATLSPGNYTAIVRGKNNTTGVGLVEVYNLQ